MGKIMKKVITKSIHKHLQNNNKHSFLKNKSNDTNLISFYHFVWENVVDQGEVKNVTYFDLGKALDFWFSKHLDIYQYTEKMQFSL